MSFSGLRQSEFDGDKNGRLYLTTHRMVFNNKKTNDAMKSFSFPFVAIRNVELEQVWWFVKNDKVAENKIHDLLFLQALKNKLRFHFLLSFSFFVGLFEILW